MNNVSLVVLAAGMGNRFGGLKQLTGVGPNGETLLEYGVYDAFQSGVRKVIFIVRRSFETEFRQVVVNRFADYMEVECVYQEINDLPSSKFAVILLATELLCKSSPSLLFFMIPPESFSLIPMPIRKSLNFSREL